MTSQTSRLDHDSHRQSLLSQHDDLHPVARSPSSIVSKITDPNGHQVHVSIAHPLNFLPYNPAPNTSQHPCQDSVSKLTSQKLVAQKELEHFYFDFQNLLVQIKEMVIETRTAGRSIREYLRDMVCGSSMSKKYETLKIELSKLPKNPTVQEVFGVLLEFLHYDNWYLLKCLTAKFLSSTNASILVSEYESKFKEFQIWCHLGTLADAHPKVFPPTSHHLSDTSVSLHLNDDWQKRPYDHLEVFRRREFNRYISEDSFHVVHMERRSIFVVWETSRTVVNELSDNCRERFSHLGSQGVLQLMIGRLELDFSVGRKPKFHKIEVSVMN